MRLYDVQVSINASNSADKIQQLNQQQAQIAQSQSTVQLNEQANTRLTQTQQLVEEPNEKAISETDIKYRQWKKNNPKNTPGRYRQKNQEEENPPGALPKGAGQIVDIKA